MLKVAPRSSGGSGGVGNLSVSDGANTVSNISLINLTGGTTNISGSGSNSVLNVQGLTVSDNVTTINDVVNIKFNGGKVSGNSASVVITSGDALIGEVVTSNLQSTVAFSNIANTYRDLIVVVRGRGENVSPNGNALVVQININGDLGNSYDTIRENRFGVFNNVSAGNFGVIGQIAPSNGPPSYPGALTARIFNYRDTNFYKMFMGIGEGVSALAAGFKVGETAGTWWRNTSPITSLSLSLSNNSQFSANCVVSLYGSL